MTQLNFARHLTSGQFHKICSFF